MEAFLCVLSIAVICMCYLLALIHDDLKTLIKKKDDRTSSDL